MSHHPEHPHLEAPQASRSRLILPPNVKRGRGKLGEILAAIAAKRLDGPERPARERIGRQIVDPAETRPAGVVTFTGTTMIVRRRRRIATEIMLCRETAARRRRARGTR